MKKIFAAVSLLVMLAQGVALAGHGIFYTESGAFQAKFSGLCPSGNVVQAICQRNAAAAAPTNAAPYLGEGEALSTSPQACSVMGTDPAYIYYVGNGELGSLNYQSDAYLYGYMRAFSGTTIPGSAYYGNSPIQAINLTSQAASDNDIVGNVTVGTVNPAYLIPWLVLPHKTNENTAIAGTVDTAASNNNKLTPSDVQVQVRQKPAGSWVNHALPYTPGVAGDFQVKAVYVGGALPVSLVYDVDGIVPEPAALLVGVLALACLRRRLRA